MLTGQAFWFFSRGTGVVTLVLFTVTMLLGITSISRWATEKYPRFVTQHLHRNVSLLALSFLTVHIVTTVMDTFVKTSLVNVIIPFTGSYRTIWVGLGALSFDLLLAVIITSLLRVKMGYGTWRAIHWLAYAMWPLAIVHGLGTGSDAKSHWMLLITGACVAAVAVALARRIAMGWSDELTPSQRSVRLMAAAATVLGPLALAAWLVTGPLTSGWGKASAVVSRSAAAITSPGAITSGTPVTVLARSTETNENAGSTTNGTSE